MFKLSFFRTAKPRQFEYIPRHYDPEKERRDERRKEILGPDVYASPDEEKYVPGAYLRERAKARRGIGSSVRRRGRSALTPLRAVLILAVLAVLVLWSTGVIDLGVFGR